MNDYNALKQQTAENQAMADQALRARMQNAGLGGGGSLTLQNNMSVGGRGNIGSVSAAQQAYTDYQSAVGSQNAANTLTQQTELAAAKYINDTNNQMDAQDQEFATWYKLYKGRKITAKQFKNKWGIDVRTISSGGSGGGGGNGGNDPETFFTSPQNGVGAMKVGDGAYVAVMGPRANR